MKNSLFVKVTMAAFLILILSTALKAQTSGDYRSVATGNWTSLSTWEYYNGTTWVAATSYPGQNANVSTVSIANGNLVTLNTSITTYKLMF